MAVERFPVEEGHILMFARAIGDPNPVYTDQDKAVASEVGGIIAPPTFVQASAQFDPDYFLRPKDGQPWLGSGATPSGSASSRDETQSVGNAPRVGSGLHAEQRFEYHRVLRAGDVLSAESYPGRTWERQGRRGGTLHFGEVVTEYRDQNGELVVTATSVGVRTERVPEQGES
jgi:acyl dehydratase